MIITTPTLRSETRPDATWIWVDVDHWESIARELHNNGFMRCEWLKGVHLGGNDFEVLIAVSTAELSDTYVVVTQIEQTIPSITSIFLSASFHERECAQMLGIAFTHLSDQAPAFDTHFDGYPLRRDFALQQRLETPWPGQVDPEKAARRRPAVPPGVNQEWSS